jgi:hypothetical protein
MFIGHLAVGFGMKRAVPEVRLWTALLAATFLDTVWPVLVLLGTEQVAIDPGNTPVTPFNFISYPWSHSLLLAVVWGVAFGGVYLWRSGTRRGAVWLGMAVVSHWVLDFISHRPDMPVIPGWDLKLGLGLWYSLPATVAVEAGMLAVGLALYLSATRPRDRTGIWALWVLVGVFVVSYASVLFAPPPPSVVAVAVGDLVGVALGAVLALWVDRHRENASPSSLS